MKSRKPVTPFSPHEARSFTLPITLASTLTLAGMLLEIMGDQTPTSRLLFVYGTVGILYLLASYILAARFMRMRKIYNTVNAILSGIGLGLLFRIIPENLREIEHILIIFAVVAVVTVSERIHAYLTLIGATVISLPIYLHAFTDIEATLEYFMPIAVSIVVTEVIIRIKDTAKQHVHRLETINNVSRRIMQTLDREETISLLDTAIQEALITDSYFIGILKDNEIELELCFDEKEYFNGLRVPVEGTLSGWVIKNQKELFLPDLRDEVELEGVSDFVGGKDKTSLSWMGVPLITENVTGILALASYTANSFDRADLELLSSLGQHVTLALDNAIRHAQVEQQARLDSLTGVFNHGYFLKQLAESAKESIKADKPLSLIMLDIDYFKQYNDTYGHLVGDRILETLCTAVKHNIKQNDAIGRWGGEEFIISLPGADGLQAVKIAKRIGQTLRSLRVEDLDHRTIPIPTISQGIAVFPSEADEIYRLIDIADQRLYKAKKRGRNQIEPDENFWDK